MVRSNSVARALHSSFGVHPTWTGVVTATLAGAVASDTRHYRATRHEEHMNTTDVQRKRKHGSAP
jgi:hypothetical protein